MGLLTFLKGFIAGLIVCAPLGPIGLLSIRRTLVNGRLAGLVSIFGASTADGFYCFIAGLGVAYIANFLRNEQRLFTVLGGLVLVALGLKLFFSKPAEKTVNSVSKKLKDAYVSSLLLMLANPMLILVFTAVFTSLGVHEWRQDYASILIMVAGVFTGSALWGPILVAVVGSLGRQLEPRHMLFLNRISGLIIFFFGVGAGLLAVIR